MKQETTLAMKAPILKNWHSNIVNENLCDYFFYPCLVLKFPSFTSSLGVSSATADQTSSTSYVL